MFINLSNHPSSRWDTKGIPSNDMLDCFTSMFLQNKEGKDEFRAARLTYLKKNGEDAFRPFTEIISGVKHEPAEVGGPTIDDIMEKAGFQLKEKTQYRCFLNKGNRICIFDKDRTSRKKLHFTFDISESSKIKKYNDGDRADIIIDEIYADVIDIQIIRILP